MEYWYFISGLVIGCFLRPTLDILVATWRKIWNNAKAATVTKED